MKTFTHFLLLLAVMVLTGLALQITVGGADRARGSVVARDESAQSANITFEWRNPNPGKDLSPDPVRFTLSTQIPLDRMRTAIESFGVADGLFQYSFTSAADRKKKEQQMKAKMAASGMTLEESTNVAKISYDWMVAKSRDELQATAAAIEKLSIEKDRGGAREMLGVFSSFVQNLEFRVPETYRKNAKGERVFTGGVLMPLETLYNGWGDCDTKSVLFASLLANVPKTGMVFLVGAKHLFVGIQATPRANDRFIEIRGIPYILVEMTTPWALGRIPDHNWNALDQSLYRIVEIYDNSN
jgi:hypothetical protein